MSVRIGIDLGGTKIEGVALDGAGRALDRRRVPTAQEEGYEAILGRIEELVAELEAGRASPARIGIGIPGSLSPADERVRNANTQCLNGRRLRPDLERRLGRSVRIENDANCFAVAEATLGAAVGFDVVFGVILGTGVGGGWVIDGAARVGPQRIAGEWGHHTLRPDGPACFCGRRGCVETYLGGPALERRWTELTGESQSLAEIVHEPMEAGAAARWKGEFVDHFALALGNVINIFDPDVVVLGGGVSNVDFLYTEGAAAARDNIFGDVRETPILRHALGDSAGVFGAALLCSAAPKFPEDPCES